MGLYAPVPHTYRWVRFHGSIRRMKFPHSPCKEKNKSQQDYRILPLGFSNEKLKDKNPHYVMYNTPLMVYNPSASLKTVMSFISPCWLGLRLAASLPGSGLSTDHTVGGKCVQTPELCGGNQEKHCIWAVKCVCWGIERWLWWYMIAESKFWFWKIELSKSNCF